MRLPPGLLGASPARPGRGRAPPSLRPDPASTRVSSLDVAMMLILLGIGFWGFLSRILWGAHWIGWAGCLGASIVAALRLLAEWKE